MLTHGFGNTRDTVYILYLPVFLNYSCYCMRGKYKVDLLC